MTRWLTYAPLAALVLLVIVGATLLLRGGERETISDGLLGRPAPGYELQSLGGGEPVRAADRAGRPYVINLFASWCAPCRVEHPHLRALQGAGVDIVGIAYKDRPEDTALFLNELGNPYSAVALDPGGRFGLELGLAGVPETFVIGADGRILAVHRGALTPEVVERVIMPAWREGHAR